MASEAQIRANRRNAQKSTGPRTPEGKARSSQNARKHGYRSADPTPSPPLDDPDFVDFVRALRRDYPDPSPDQSAALLQFAASYYHLRSIGALEDQAFYGLPYDPAVLIRKGLTFLRYAAPYRRAFFQASRFLFHPRPTPKKGRLHERTQFPAKLPL